MKGLLLNFPCGSPRTPAGRCDDGDSRDVDPAGREGALGLARRGPGREDVVAEHHHGARVTLRKSRHPATVDAHRVLEVGGPRSR